MKVSAQWIAMLLSGRTLTPEEIAQTLTMHSFETTIARSFVIDPAITVVEILKIEKHPNADRLQLATITDGKQEVQVVCGAPNIAEGQLVPFAPVGAQVYDDSGELFTLKEATIRGVVSTGMLNSSRELGIADDHGGILVLPEGVSVGAKLCEYIPGDTILDVDVLPDRAKDVTSHVAIAREVAASTGGTLGEIPEATPVMQLFQSAAGIAEFGSMPKEGDTPRRILELHPNRPAQVAGVDISADNVKQYVERLGFTVDDANDVWNIGVPHERVDVLGEHDLIDEVVRLHGLDSIQPSDIVSRMRALPVSNTVYWEAAVRDMLARQGFTETYSYSFEDSRMAKLLSSDTRPHVELINPMAPELKNLRYSMLPGLLRVMIKNREDIHRQKKQSEYAVFELGRAYHVGDGGVVPGVVERRVISGIMVGGQDALPEIIERICDLFGIDVSGVSYTQKDLPFAHVQQMSIGGEFLGITYVLSSELLTKMKYRVPLVAFEVSLLACMKHGKDVEIPVRTLHDIAATKETPTQFVELPKFPSVFRDVSLLVDPSVQTDAVQAEIARIGGEVVVDVDLFDEYTPDTGKKGLAFHLEYRVPDRTLTDTEVADTHAAIEHALKKEFDAEVR